MHLSERGTVEVELVVDHFVYSFLHFVHIVDGHYFCCTLVRELQPTVSLNLRFTMSAFHTRYNFTETKPRWALSTRNVVGKNPSRTFGASSMADLRRFLRLVSVLERHSLFTSTPLCIWFVALEFFSFTLGWNLTTHTQLRSPNCAVTSMRAWASKINASNQSTITDQNLFAEDSRISTHHAVHWIHTYASPSSRFQNTKRTHKFTIYLPNPSQAININMDQYMNFGLHVCTRQRSRYSSMDRPLPTKLFEKLSWFFWLTVRRTPAYLPASPLPVTIWFIQNKRARDSHYIHIDLPTIGHCIGVEECVCTYDVYSFRADPS